MAVAFVFKVFRNLTCKIIYLNLFCVLRLPIYIDIFKINVMWMPYLLIHSLHLYIFTNNPIILRKAIRAIVFDQNATVCYQIDAPISYENNNSYPDYFYLHVIEGGGAFHFFGCVVWVRYG